MNTLYENIKKYRQRYGWTQEELSKKVGYSGKEMISRIEKGDIDLSLSKVEKFAEVFGIRPGVLIGWLEESETEKNIIQYAELLGKYASLDERGRDAIEWMIEHELNRKE